jgi:hypothetical protein
VSFHSAHLPPVNAVFYFLACFSGATPTAGVKID